MVRATEPRPRWASGGGEAEMKVAVVSRKGGVGKTVTALHLAGYLAEVSGEEKVLLVDTDPSLNAFRAAERGKRLGGGYPFAVVKEGDAFEARRQMRPEHIVVDVKGSPEAEDVRDLALDSEVLVMPAMPGYMEIDTVLQTMRDVRGVGREGVCRVLLTAVPPRSMRGREARRELEGLDVPLFRNQVRRYEAVQDSVERGVLVGELSGWYAQKAARDYAKVGKELLEWVREIRTRDLGPAGSAVGAVIEDDNLVDGR